MAVVTIRGQLGSGAPEVAKHIADRLQADYVDREIIAKVAARLQREEEEVKAKETPPTTLLGRIAEALEHSYAFGDGVAGAYLSLGEIPLEDTRYLQALESVVKDLVRKQPLVIVGRGSQFILKDYPGALHVLIVAPLQVRMKRLMESRKLDQESARLELERSDKSRREFIRRYFKAEVEDPVHYDVVLNTECLSIQAASSIVVHALPLKAQTKQPL